MDYLGDSSTPPKTQNIPNAVEGLQGQCQISEGDEPYQPDNAKEVKHVMPSAFEKGPDALELTTGGAIERLKHNGTTSSLPRDFAIIRKLRSRAGSDSPIESLATRGRPGMRLSPISSTTSESSWEDGALLTQIMNPTISDDGIASEDEDPRMADHAMLPDGIVSSKETNERLSRTISSSSDHTPSTNRTQSPMPSPLLDPCDIIKVVPRPEFPIRVNEDAPPPFSQEAQNRSIRWVHDICHFAPYPELVVELSGQRIRDTLQPHLNHLGYESETAYIKFLSMGGFHKVYTITTLNQETKQPKIFVLRVPLPADPYFKTESDVATTEIVRHTTSVPVPVIYAYDSSSNNALGFEWILMEYIDEKPMYEYWEKMDYDSKVRFTNRVAEWNTQLANIVSKKMGAIYLRYTATYLQFYVGRCVDSLLTQENRLSYDIFRGPFETPADFFASVLAVTAQDVNDLRRKNRAGLMRDVRYQFLDRISTMRKPIDEEEIKDWQEKRERDLDVLSTAIETLQERLPALSKHLLVIDSSSRLSHHDLSLSNVLADENGMPIALLDWEFSELRPMMFLADSPNFIEGSELSYEPEPHLMPADAHLRFSAEKLHKYEVENQKYYLEELEIYTKQKLRSEYRAALRRLDSPLQHANWEDFGEALWKLYCHIMFIWVDTKDIVGWVKNQCKSDPEDESEEDGEEERGGGGGGEECEYDEHENEINDIEVGDIMEVEVGEDGVAGDMIRVEDGEKAAVKDTLKAQDTERATMKLSAEDEQIEMADDKAIEDSKPQSNRELMVRGRSQSWPSVVRVAYWWFDHVSE